MKPATKLEPGCQQEPCSVSLTQRERNLVYATEHYSEAVNYFDEAPPNGYICANCGDTTDDAGRFRDAEPHEAELADAANEIYECSTCGSSMCLPPQNDPALAPPPQCPACEKNVTGG